MTVDRNVNAPVFVSTYSKTINENIPLGTSVLTVEARDEDGVRILYYVHLHSYSPVLPDVLVYEVKLHQVCLVYGDGQGPINNKLSSTVNHLDLPCFA